MTDGTVTLGSSKIVFQVELEGELSRVKMMIFDGRFHGCRFRGRKGREILIGVMQRTL